MLIYNDFRFLPDVNLKPYRLFIIYRGYYFNFCVHIFEILILNNESQIHAIR